MPLTAGRSPIGCKWLFKIKRHVNGSIAGAKVRLVAKGFSHKARFDFQETFTLVVKWATIRIGLSLALTHNWCLRQVDINNEFIHVELTEEVYMVPPPGFKQQSFSDSTISVCKLQKALYGLKQDPHAWFEELKSFLLHSLTFTVSIADNCLFIKAVIICLFCYSSM